MRWLIDLGIVAVHGSACTSTPRGAQLVEFRGGVIVLCDYGRIVVRYYSTRPDVDV